MPCNQPSSPLLNLELGRLLYPDSCISPAPQDVTDHADQQESSGDDFTKIGAGACGVIFSQAGTENALKLSKQTDPDELWNDYKTHHAVERAVREHHLPNFRVPGCYGYIPKTDEKFWHDNSPHTLVHAAKDEVHLPCNVLVSERIRPLPLSVRQCLIDKFCAPKIKEAALADPANTDCLIRPYLGSTSGRTSSMFFSLRNFKLHLNQMKEIGLDVQSMAETMGKVLAIMHWKVGIDARDVEFVLGSSAESTGPPLYDDFYHWTLETLSEPQSTIGPESRQLRDFGHRTTCLWLLDFNQARPMSDNEEGVEQALEAFWINDPYYPRPPEPIEYDDAYYDNLRNNPSWHYEKTPWDWFEESYLVKSDELLSSGSFYLAQMFLERVEEMQEEEFAKRKEQGGRKRPRLMNGVSDVQMEDQLA